MKNSFILLILFNILVSCSYFFPEEAGELSVYFSKDVYMATKAREDIPDTNSFILTVKSSKGEVLYSGIYGAAPQPIAANPGTYTVSAVSGIMESPAFSAPVYGDECQAVVSAGESTTVRLVCAQVNAGLRLQYSPSFCEKYPDASVRVVAESGSLMYDRQESRTGFFPVGRVQILLNSDGERPVGSRMLRAREILTLELSAVESAGGTVSIQVDTARNWSRDCLLVGDGEETGGGTDIGDALSVSEARECSGEEVWVYGYVVGGDLSSSKASFAPPFASKTNLVLAEKSSCQDKDRCLSVQLRQGDIRDVLNLVDNPSMLGRQVFLRGKVVPSYYGIPGLQEISEFYLPSD